jgi:hypothetical protein
VDPVTRALRGASERRFVAAFVVVVPLAVLAAWWFAAAGRPSEGSALMDREAVERALLHEAERARREGPHQEPTPLSAEGFRMLAAHSRRAEPPRASQAYRPEPIDRTAHGAPGPPIAALRHGGPPRGDATRSPRTDSGLRFTATRTIPLTTR